MPRDHIAVLIWGAAFLVAIMIGATTAPRFSSVMLRTLLLYLCALSATVYVTGAMERGFGSRWLMSAHSWAENFGRYLSLLLPAGIAWGIARWVRRGRQIREERRRQLLLLENYAPPLPEETQRQG